MRAPKLDLRILYTSLLIRRVTERETVEFLRSGSQYKGDLDTIRSGLGLFPARAH